MHGLLQSANHWMVSILGSFCQILCPCSGRWYSDQLGIKTRCTAAGAYNDVMSFVEKSTLSCTAMNKQASCTVGVSLYCNALLCTSSLFAVAG